jgi:2,3-bisphosphoglycerate-dependent phosphoglycerate mutase
LTAGKTVLVAAHGNSIRAIIKSLFDLDEKAILEIEVPTGNPLVVRLDPALKPQWAKYLDEARANPLPQIVEA